MAGIELGNAIALIFELLLLAFSAGMAGFMIYIVFGSTDTPEQRRREEAARRVATDRRAAAQAARERERWDRWAQETAERLRRVRDGGTS